MGDRTPSLPEAINAAVVRALFDVHTSMNARVESFDKDACKVDVTPLLKRRSRKEDGEIEHLPCAMIRGVPCAFYGAGGVRFTLAPKKGDTCHLVMNEADFSTWLKNGGESSSSSPRRFNFNDAVAYFGLRADSEKWTGASADDATLGYDGGPQIIFKSDQLHLGAAAGDDATEKAYLGSTHKQKLDDMLDSVKSAAQNMITACTQAATFMGTAAGKNAVPMYGGAAASSDFGQVAAQLGQLAAQFGSMVAAITTYRSGGPYLSDKVKLK